VKDRISELERIIGKQTVQIEILKKFLSKAGDGLSGLLAEGLLYPVTAIWAALGWHPSFIDGSRQGGGPTPGHLADLPVDSGSPFWPSRTFQHHQPCLPAFKKSPQSRIFASP
jgi:hypothetical protein